MVAVAFVTNKSARTCDNTCESVVSLTRSRPSHRLARALSRSHTSGSTPHPRRSAAAGDAHRPKVSDSDTERHLWSDSDTFGRWQRHGSDIMAATPNDTDRRAAGTIHQVGLSRGLEVGQRTVHRGGRRFGHQVGIRPASRTEVTPKKIVLQQQRAHEAERPRIRVAELRSAWALAGESCARAPRSNTRCRGMQSREGQDGHDQASCWASREGQYGDDQNP